STCSAPGSPIGRRADAFWSTIRAGCSASDMDKQREDFMAHSPIDTPTIGPDDLNRYGPTAARPVNTDRIRLKTRTVDAHAHLMIPAADSYIEPFTTQETRPLLRQANPL